jgi:hypothetical protein
MAEEQQRLRLPIKSPSTGFTLALMSREGLELYCKRTRQWEIHSIDEIMRIYEDVTKMADPTQDKDKTA